MTTLTMKIKQAINNEKGSKHIYITIAELKTLVSMQRVKYICCSVQSRPQTSIDSNQHYPMTNNLRINRKQANEIVDDRLKFESAKKETHYERVYISSWIHGSNTNNLYISI
tara:strand:- start:529 stop:864 length:336 start_codon:yes stop_codon:yes gene_type:complete